MKKYFFLGLLLMSFSSFAAGQALINRLVPSDVVQAFRTAGLPVLRERVPSVDFTLPLLNGQNISLSSLRGQVVFLNFWATWCPPCRDEMPSMQALYERFKEQGLEILTVNLRENPRVVNNFMSEHRLTFLVAMDSTGMVSQRYNVRGIPATYIIDREGAIILFVNGALDWSRRDIVSAFEVLLNHGR